MKTNRKPPNYWTKNKCHELALKCKTRGEFQNKYPIPYNISLSKKWLDEICGHMNILKKKWTKEECHELSLKCKTRNEFRITYNAARIYAQRRGWYEDICSHMTEGNKNRKYWSNKKRCQDESLNHNHRTDFYKKSRLAYEVSRDNDWLDEICSHMNKHHNDYSGYVYEFPDKHFYVGITSRETKRKNDHKKDTQSAVYKYSELTNLTPKMKKIFPAVDTKKSKKLEEQWVNHYIEKGWIKLNIAKTGSLGGTIIKWTKQKCHEKSLLYNTRTEFRNDFPGAYESAYNNNWLDEICSHMYKRKSIDYWNNKTLCHEESLKFTSRYKFSRDSTLCYIVSRDNGWLNDICSHMNTLQIYIDNYEKKYIKKQNIN